MQAVEGRELLAVSVPHFDHIVVVMGDNRSYLAIVLNSVAPLISRLAAMCGCAQRRG